MMMQGKTDSRALISGGAKDEKLFEMEKAVALIFNKAFEEGSKAKGFIEVLGDVQALLESLILGDIKTAEKYLVKFSALRGQALFVEVGKRTKKLHKSIRKFQESISPRLKNLPVNELPEANDKLQWVINRTEEAASRTISLVEKHLGNQENSTQRIHQLEGVLKKSGLIDDSSFKVLDSLKAMNLELPKDLMEILIAQDFQDLTGQIIKKVIHLIADIESQLVQILKIFGVKLESDSSPGILHGPQIKKNEQAASDQLEVDALLNQFGF